MMTMDRANYIELSFVHGDVSGIALIRLDENGYCDRRQFMRPDGLARTDTRIGDTLSMDGETITVTAYVYRIS